MTSKWLKWTSITAFALTMGVSSVRAETEVVFAHVFAANSLEHQTAERFAARASELSGGSVQVEVFPGSQLGGFAQIANQQRSGAIHVTWISTTALGSFTPVATVDSWPYLFETREQFEAAYESDVGKAFFEKIEADSGYRVLAPSYKGLRYVYVRKEASSLEGLKIRVPGLPVVLRSFESWGASPTPMDVAEIYTAMQQGVVDGIEIEAQTAVSIGLADVTKTVLLTRHMMPNYAFIVFGEWLDNLPEADRQAVESAASEASDWFSSEIAKQEEAALETLGKTAEMVEVDTAAMKEQSAKTLREEFPELHEWVEKLRTAAGM